jgi:hypothetical protein
MEYYVPTGLESILCRMGVGVERIHELGWWEEGVYMVPLPMSTNCRTEAASSQTPVHLPMIPLTPLKSSADHCAISHFASPLPADLPDIPDRSPDRKHWPAAHPDPTAHGPDFEVKLEPKPRPRLELDIDMPSTPATPPAPVRLVCLPAQHNSGRHVFRRNETLWATWLVECLLPSGDAFRCFFGG